MHQQLVRPREKEDLQQQKRVHVQDVLHKHLLLHCTSQSVARHDSAGDLLGGREEAPEETTLVAQVGVIVLLGGKLQHGVKERLRMQGGEEELHSRGEDVFDRHHGLPHDDNTDFVGIL